MPPEAYYTAPEATKELDCSLRWIYMLLDSGKLAGYQPNGRHWRIRPRDLRRYQRERQRRKAA